MKIQSGQSNRVGLISTNSIRHGTNRLVLDEINQTGNIFLAWSDREWILDGAAVRVSIIGFDNGDESSLYLDGNQASKINSDLTSRVDVTISKPLSDNLSISFRCDEKGGPFDINAVIAGRLISAINASGLSNSEVVRPFVNATDIVRRPRNAWIIDFGCDTPIEEAQKYELPFSYIEEVVKPIREKSKNKLERTNWWLHRRPAPDMRSAVSALTRFIATPRVAKHRLFVFLDSSMLPNSRVIAIAREDDYFLGVLHSHIHKSWTLSLCGWIGAGNDPVYTPTSVFETFPFPWSPGEEPSESEDERVAEISHWARELVQWREAWLNPPREGLYAGVGDAYEKMLKKRTLTNLYNGLVYYRQTVKTGDPFIQSEFDKVTRKSVSRDEIQELDDIHTALDQAVLDAYGWSHDLSDEEILERLLALNLERAKIHATA